MCYDTKYNEFFKNQVFREFSPFNPLIHLGTN